MQTRNVTANDKITIGASCNDESTYTDRDSSVRLLKIPRAAPEIKEFGFRLTRSKWDPYPWVCEVAAGTPASLYGLKAGDCILKVNGVDILGMKIIEVSQIVKSQGDHVTFLCWNSDWEIDCDKHSITCVPMPISLKRLTVIVDSILKAIECPVCNVTITPPAMQCQNGHLLCLDCRIRTAKCPICRGFFTPTRSTVAENIYSIIAIAFKSIHSEGKFRHRVFSDMTCVKDRHCHHCLTTTNTKSMPAFELSINSFLTKLLQARVYFPENIDQLHPRLTKVAEPKQSEEFLTMNHELQEKDKNTAQPALIS